MSLVEKEVTMNNVELAKNSTELLKRREREQKFIPKDPNQLRDLFEAEAATIEQIYLSSPTDEFSLRIRSTEQNGSIEYTATLKDRGEVVDGARDRLEVNTPISKEAFEWFEGREEYARLSKKRATPAEGVTVDFFEHDNLQVVEIEHNDLVERARLVLDMQYLTNGGLVDKTEDLKLDNEAIAHQVSHTEILSNPESLDVFAGHIAKEMIANYALGKNQVVAGLTGMSGSGKTTVTRAVQEKIAELIGEDYTPLVVSTDDYHFGKTYLETTYGTPWTEWDDPRTYNTAALANDIQMMAEGQSLIRRHFNFDTEEPQLDDEVQSSPFIIIEGLYAGSKDLNGVRDLHFELPTSIATGVGRDIRRLVIENRANRVFPTPESRLKYQLETALPLYLTQERPRRNSFSASSRPMTARAFMLSSLTE